MWTLEKINTFDEIIDVRSPSEYAKDHIPGAHNFPALDNDERIKIGTIYRQQSAFEAKKQGAALLASNISHYLEEYFASRNKNWQPLIYCWRGGGRSNAFTHVLRQIGWNAVQLPGGYKAYRKLVMQTIEDVVPRLMFVVLCGRTGVGKSMLLEKLAENGAQVLELEALANHRGSVLGEPQHGTQPTQKRFESQLCQHILKFKSSNPVFVEAESRKIGRIQLPGSLLMNIRASHCVLMEASTEDRVNYLIDEYEHFLDDPILLQTALTSLIPFRGKEKVASWLNWKQQGGAQKLVTELLHEHYDPIYLKSMQGHFKHYTQAVPIHLEHIDDECMQKTAQALMDKF